jgi:hypothetical protein
MKALSLPFVVGLSILFASAGISYGGDDEDTISRSMIKQGFQISPIPFDKLDLHGRDPRLVALGSYFVNGPSDCGGCHSFPRFLPKGNTAGSNPAAGDPYLATSPSDQSLNRQLVANFNISHHLAGGQCFGPFMARNLTPEPNGLPQGLTEDEFLKVIRTGEDIHCEKESSDPICALGPDTPVLQVMPWPSYHSMTDAQLRAIYAYLSSLPPLSPCNTVADGCPGVSGKAAANPTAYAYPNTDDCPNPAPPQ